jgi:hypothetical protein
VAPAPPPPPEPPLPEGAEEGVPTSREDSKQKRDDKRVSITLSPLHLLSPIFEAQVDVMIVPHFGMALLGGVGTITAESNDPVIDGEKFSAYELGGQLIAYPLRDFSSLQLGAELLWIHVSTESFAGTEVTANAGGVAAGPLVGYKLITKAGFTFFVQGGFQYAFVQAEASDSQGNRETAEKSDFIPLLNLNLGWSF